jgi:glycosyltransferase involved in cell wall biosynthesis
MERLKCLLVHNYEIENGGVSILNYDFAEFLTNQDWQVTIFSPLAKFYKEKAFFNLEWRFKNLERLVYEADVILINLSPYLWKSYLKTIEFCKKYNKHYFIWFHVVLDKDVYKKRYGKKDFEKRAGILKEILNNDLCQKVICVSQAVKNYLDDLVEKEKLITLYPGVKIFEREKAEIFGDLLYVGRFSEEKNVQILIRALGKLKNDFPKIKLNLVGSGPEEEKLKKMVKRFGLEKNVQFLGHLKREEIFSLYQTHKILVLPSKIESLGLVIVEALSQNLVPITRKTYGPKEVLNNEIFFFDGNENELYEKIKDVLRNYERYKKIVLEIKKEILSKFDYEQNFSLMERIILESILFKKEKIPVFKIEPSPVFV